MTSAETSIELSLPHGVQLRAPGLPAAQWLAHLVRELSASGPGIPVKRSVFYGPPKSTIAAH